MKLLKKLLGWAEPTAIEPAPQPVVYMEIKKHSRRCERQVKPWERHRKAKLRGRREALHALAT